MDESPIELVRVSYLKQYVCVVFKDNPMELWDLRSFTLLRQMSCTFPIITALVHQLLFHDSCLIVCSINRISCIHFRLFLKNHAFICNSMFVESFKYTH